MTHLHHTHYTCRKCQYDINGLGAPCSNCGEPQRIPLRLADGNIRYLPAGMTLADFDEMCARPWLRAVAAKPA